MQVVPSWLSASEARVAPVKDLFIRSEGLRIHAVLNSRGNISGKPCAVMIHGFHSDADELARLAICLASYGWVGLRLDLRGNGLSEGHPDDINGYVRDVRSAVDHLLRSGADPGRIFLVGQSLGGAVAITEAAIDPRTAGVVALHPSSKYELGAYNPPIGHPDVRRPIDIVARISPRPLLILAGENDPVLPCSGAKELYNAALAPKRMLEIKDGTHAIEDTEAYVMGWLLAGAPHV